MEANPAQRHYGWRVQVGSSRQISFGGGPINFTMQGYGCLIAPRLVLTSWQVWQASQRTHSSVKTGPQISSGKTIIECELAGANEGHDLALLRTTGPLTDAAGTDHDPYPNFSSTEPTIGQWASVLIQANLADLRLWGEMHPYDCLAGSSISLLSFGNKTSYALSGIMMDTAWIGNAVLDAEGDLLGIVTGYFTGPTPNAQAQRLAQRYIVFTPVTAAMTKAMLAGAELLKR